MSWPGRNPPSDKGFLEHVLLLLFLADEAVRTLIRLVQPQLQETVATTELGNVMAGQGTLLAWGVFPWA